jgi:hypothetical protein
MLLEFGYPQETVPMYVDSQCAMQMLQQGTGSFKRAKHIKVQFFWMKELLDNGSLKLIYMPTDELVADILTKPLTGWKFQYLLYKLIGWNSSKLLNFGDTMDQVAEEVLIEEKKVSDCWGLGFEVGRLTFLIFYVFLQPP